MSASAVVDRAAQAVEASDAKPAPSAEVKSAAKKPGKYTDEVRKATTRAQEIRQRANAVAPVTVTRVQEALGKTKPMDALKGLTIKDAMSYAAGDKSIKLPETAAKICESLADPFARARGFVAICLALAGK